MDINETDWKVFRKLSKVALERYCERVLKDVPGVVEEPDSSDHERYLKLWELLRSRDKTIANAFNNPRRSQAMIQLANIVAEDLLTDAELNQFSNETLTISTKPNSTPGSSKLPPFKEPF